MSSADEKIKLLIPVADGKFRTYALHRSAFSFVLSAFCVFSLWGIVSTGLLVWILLHPADPQIVVKTLPASPITPPPTEVKTTETVPHNSGWELGNGVILTRAAFQLSGQRIRVLSTLQRTAPDQDTLWGTFWVRAYFVGSDGASVVAQSTQQAGIQENGLTARPHLAGSFELEGEETIHETIFKGKIPKGAQLSRLQMGLWTKGQQKSVELKAEDVVIEPSAGG